MSTTNAWAFHGQPCQRVITLFFYGKCIMCLDFVLSGRVPINQLRPKFQSKSKVVNILFISPG